MDYPDSKIHGMDGFIQFVREISPEADVDSVLLFGQIHRSHNFLETLMEHRLERVGLSWAKFRLMMDLMRVEKHGERAGLQPSELSERQDISRKTVSALISSLEKEGLISRQPHGADRRKFLIQLTPAGRKLLLAQMSHHFTYLSHIFRALPAEDRQHLLDHLLRLNNSLREQARQCKMEAHEQPSA